MKFPENEDISDFLSMNIKSDGSDPHLLKPYSLNHTIPWYGYNYTTSTHTDGGCYSSSEGWIESIQRIFGEDKVWDSGLDWCAGDGGVGLMMLGSGRCKSMAFTEPYPIALENLYKNLNQNSLSCKVFEIDNIQSLDGKYDLVIGNSPSARIPSLLRMYELGWLRKNSHDPLKYEDALEDLKSKNPHRAFDYYWNIHKEFFAHIEKNLNPGADIILLENPKDFNPLFWEWGKTNLKIECWVDHNQIKSFPKPQVVLHLKYV